MGEAEVFRGFQWQAVHAAVQAMYLAGLSVTIADILRSLRDLGALVLEVVRRRFPDLTADSWLEVQTKYETRLASKSIHRSTELDDLFAQLQYPPEYYSKMIAGLLPQLERLAAGYKRELLSPRPKDAAREILTWPTIDKRRLVVYFYLGSLHGEESAGAVGKMLLLDLQSYIASRYSYQDERARRRISLVVDEAHHMVSRPFMHLLAEGRGANVACVLSSQTTAQFERAFGSRAAVDELLTQNFVHVQFQTRNPREARDFSDLAGKRQLRVFSESHAYEPVLFASGWQAVDDFRARHMQSVQMREMDLVPAWAIAQLPTFHFFARLSGRIEKGRIPLVSDRPERFSRGIKEGGAA